MTRNKCGRKLCIHTFLVSMILDMEFGRVSIHFEYLFLFQHLPCSLCPTSSLMIMIQPLVSMKPTFVPGSIDKSTLHSRNVIMKLYKSLKYIATNESYLFVHTHQQYCYNVLWNVLCNFAEDVYQQQARIDGEPAQINILDTAGQVLVSALPFCSYTC